VTHANVIGGLIQGLDGAPMPSAGEGKSLFAADAVNVSVAIPAGRVPALILQSLRFDIKPWNPQKNKVIMVASCLLKVLAPKAGEGAPLGHSAMDDLERAAERIRGIPVDVDGNVRPYDRTSTPVAWRDGKLALLADSGPFFVGGTLRDIPGTPYAEGEVTFRTTYKPELWTTEDRRVQVIALGLRPFDVARVRVDDIGRTVLSPLPLADYTGQTKYDTSFPDVPDNVELGDPPFVGGESEPGALGTDTDTIVDRIILAPSAQTLVAPNTVQLVAIAQHRDMSTQPLLAAGLTWASSDAGVASVSGGGLVTAVSSGTANITATYLGALTSEAAVITVS
jgi:hypothetical protein